MKLIQLYRALLDYCGLAVTDEGAVVLPLPDGSTKPFEVEKRALGLPVTAQYNAYNPDTKMIFHPLQEHINRGESEIVKTLRYHMNVRINLATIQLATALLEVAGSRALHAQMTPEHRELLKAVPNVDLKSAANFIDFMNKKFKEHPVSAVSNIFLKKAGTYKGEKHNRIGVVAFPYYDLFTDADCKLRQADKADFVTLMEYIFPGSKTDPEAFNAFSDSNDAPWLDAMLKSSYNLTARINELIELFDPLFKKNDDDKLEPFNVSWVDAMDHLDSLRAEIRSIPSQAGNEGTVITKEGTEKSTLQPVASRPVPATRTAEPDPYRQPEPAPQPYPAPPPYPQAYPQGYPQAYPQAYPQGYPPPGYPQPPVAPPPQGPRITEEGKLDFRSISSLPQIAAAAPAAAAMAGWVQPPVYGAPAAPQVGYNGRAIAPTGGYPPGYDRRTPMMPVQQQVLYDAYGRPVDAYGRLLAQPMPVNPYGQPVPPGGITNI